jgi:cell volume regulation protein A
MTSLDQIFIVAGLLLLLSVALSKALSRTGIPALLVFLAIGMLAGSDGIGGIHFENYGLAQALGISALIFILYSGGLDTKIDNIRPVLKSGLFLSTLGVLISACSVGAFAKYAFGFSWLNGLLLGAIVSSTDAAAVFSVLRSRGTSLKGRLKPLLEFESGSNDPMAVFLTTSLLGLMVKDQASGVGLVLVFFQQLIVGAVFGFAIGKGAAKLINKIKLEYEGLYPALSISVVILAYGLTQALGGNGFLAVYLAGIILGNERFIYKRSLLRFHDGLAWMMQITMFLILGLLVFPKDLFPLMGWGIALAIFLVFVARPLSVHISLLRARFNWREKAMISWVGLRGAVPIILATYPFLAELPQATTIFNLVFFVVIVSILLQGTSIPLFARLLKVDAPIEPFFRYPLEFNPEVDAKGDLTEVPVPKDSAAVGKAIVELNLPPESLIALIQRSGEVFIPKGGSVIESGDKLLILSDEAGLHKVKEILSQQLPL